MTNFNKLKDKWYKKLKQSGFEDAENSDGTLKEFHSFKFISAASQLRQRKREGYQRNIDQFSKDESFDSICRALAKKSQFSKKRLAAIWNAHCKGVTEREIASVFKCSKTCIHKIIEKFRAWMIIT